MPTLRIRLLGRFSVQLGEAALTVHQAQAHLLALLAMKADQGAHRLRIAGILWPDVSDVRARANLSTVLWRLKTMLVEAGASGEIIRASGDRLWLDGTQTECDAVQFVQNSSLLGVREGSLEPLARAASALELYGGDLLEDWDADWCVVERESLRGRHLELLQAVSEGFERRGRLDLAIRHARRAVTAEPLNEVLQRRLIRLHLLSGDRAAAISQFRGFSALVTQELGVDPDQETMALIRDMERRPGGLPESSRPVAPEGIIRPDHIPMVGRREEKQATGAVLDAALGGSGGGVLIVGEGGLGKSRLAEWALEEWSSRGGAIARGRCLEFNEPVPYQPLLDALGRYVSADELTDFIEREKVRETLLGPLASMPEGPGLPQHDASRAGRLRLLAWLRGRLEAITRQRPLLVVLEDLQWADTGTIDFVAYMMEHAANMKLAVLLTSRLSSSRPTHGTDLQRLARHAALVCRLQPLDEAGAFALVELLLGRSDLPGNLLAWVYKETEGHPLFIVETLRLLHQRGQLEWIHARTHPPGVRAGDFKSSMPHGVRSIIEHRLSLLDKDPTIIVGAASVIGRSCDAELLGAISRMSENRFSRAVAHLVGSGILEREGIRLRFSHDKIREICYEQLPVRTRRAYHSKCANLLAESPDASPFEVAWHQQSAGQWHLAAKSWREAGDRARAIHAFHEALRAYQNALVCLKQDRASSVERRPEQEFELLSCVEQVLAVVGDPGERRKILGKMGALLARGTMDGREAWWLLRRAVLEDHVGRYAQAADLARRAVFAAGDARDSGTVVMALRVLACTLSRAGRSARSVAVSQLALRKLGSEDSPIRAAILAEASVAYMKLGQYEVARRLTRQAKDYNAGLGHLDDDPLICTTSAVVLKWIGELGPARADALKAAKIYRQDEDVVSEARATFQLATLDALEGDLAAALGNLRRAKVVLRSAGYSRIYAGCLNEVAYGIGRQLGNYSWAWHASRLALSLPNEHRNPYTTAIYLDSQVQLLIDENRLDEASEQIAEVLNLLAQGYLSTTQHLESLARRGAIWFYKGQHALAIADLETAVSEQRRRGAVLFLPNGLSYLALAQAALGDQEQALRNSGEAVRVLTEINFANHQPQRIFWHHYLILTKFGQTPRLPFLARAVDLIERQARTLSRAQQQRFRRDVRLNREILAAWEAAQRPSRSDLRPSPVPQASPKIASG